MIAVQKTLEERKLMAYSKRRKAADKSAQDVWMEEMEQGLPGAPEAKLSDTVVDGFEDGDSSAVFPAAQKGRKTKKERRKEQQLQVQVRWFPWVRSQMLLHLRRFSLPITWVCDLALDLLVCLRGVSGFVRRWLNGQCAILRHSVPFAPFAGWKLNLGRVKSPVG